MANSTKSYSMRIDRLVIHEYVNVCVCFLFVYQSFPNIQCQLSRVIDYNHEYFRNLCNIKNWTNFLPNRTTITEFNGKLFWSDYIFFLFVCLFDNSWKINSQFVKHTFSPWPIYLTILCSDLNVQFLNMHPNDRCKI